ncbi:MAG: PTS sugar transporter subunit IIA [Gluconacetobacter diazotrophicus]|nr:PTS sugar transporter subunit IIA [Gluconacetobacter diazotrophicus]
MIGIVLVTHGAIGDALRDAMEHVVGAQKQVATLSIGAEDDIQHRRRELEAAVAAVDSGDGVILLTDMFGGTPSNLAISMLNRDAGGRTGIEVIAGVNLPMLVKLGKIRSSRTMPECVELAEIVGRKYIAAASNLPEACLGGAACCSMAAPGTPPATADIVREPEARRPAMAG